MKFKQRLPLLAAVVMGMSVLGIPPSSAFVPVDQSHLEVPLESYPVGVYKTLQSEEASRAVTTAIRENYGGEWRVHSWNPQTQTPHRIYGSGLAVRENLYDDAGVERAALAVATERSDVLGLNPDDLELVTVRRGLGKVAAHFQQTWNGYEVHGGRFHATFMETGTLFVMGSDFYSSIDLSPSPALSAGQAEDIAIRDLDFDPAESRFVGETELVVLPIPLEIDQVRYHLAYHMRVEVSPTQIWETYVDAHAGVILWRYNDVHFFSGTTEADVQHATYCNGETREGVGYMDVNVDGQGTTTSDSDGNWAIGPGLGSADVSASFFGPYVNVNRQSGGSDAVFNGTADGAVPFAIEWDDGNSRQDERDVFDSISDIHDFFDEFDAGFSYHNQRITARVGVSGTCNAFWNGTINFYNEGGGCANTGEIQGVVHHEFGHGVQNSILGSQGSEGLGEGNSDILANFLTDESHIGRGFNLGNCTSGIRNSDNNLQYPDDLTGSVHSDGRIMAGVVWDVRQNLEASLGAVAGELRAAELWHFGRVLETPFNQPDQVFSMFVADDNDGDLINGTPNFDAICAGAEAHGFECPVVIIGPVIVHTPPASPHPSGSVDLAADVTTTVTGAAIDPGTVVLDYWINEAGPTSVVMNHDGGSAYSASISLSDNQELAYQISAEDDFGNDGSSPLDAPVTLHYVDAPTSFDDVEADSGWSVNDEGTDDASTGVWVRVNPNGTAAQPEDDHTPPPGVNAWVTGQGPVGGGLGENDIDGGSTTLYSPTYDATGATFAIVKYWRWYSNTTGASPNADTWVVQVRNNGGGWVDVERNQEDQNEWVQIRVDLLDLFASPEDIEFKFIGSDLGSGSLVEAAVDDVSIIIDATDPADVPNVDDSVARFALHGARPNPVAGAGSIVYQVPTRTDVAITVYDVSGRSLRTLAQGPVEAGVHSVEWDGKDARGHELSSGVYYVRMSANEYEATRPVVLQK